MFESISFAPISRWFRDKFYVEPYMDRKKEFSDDLTPYLKNRSKTISVLSPREQNFLVHIGGALYSVRHMTVSVEYINDCFYEEFGQYSAEPYKQPKDVVSFIKNSKIPDLDVLVLVENKDLESPLITLSENFRIANYMAPFLEFIKHETEPVKA